MYSYSKVSCFIDCPQKYKYRYIDKLPEPSNMYFEFGTKFHESIQTGVSDNPDIQEMLDTLFSNSEFLKYKDRITHYEKKYIYDLNDEQFISYLDAEGDDFILEFKSASKQWSDSDFSLELQSHLYMEASKNGFDDKKFIYFIVTKPNKKGECHVQVKEIPKDKDKIELILRTVRDIKSDSKFTRKKNKWCWFCSFRDQCQIDNGRL